MSSRLYSAVSLFSGCGGSDLGSEEAGIEVVWANEIDPTACELYELVTGTNGVINPGNVTGVRKFPKADLLIGCYPCQGYSQGGRRDSGDKINYLYREFDRALRQIKPLAFIVENVDGMSFSQNSKLLGNQLTRYRLAGYRVTWQVLNAKDYGVAQNRRRLFIVGIRSREDKRYEFPKPTHGPQKGLEKYRTLKDTIWDLRTAPDGSYNTEPFHWYYLSRNRRRTWAQQSSCIVAHWRHIGLHPSSPPLRRIHTDKWEFSRDGRARRLSYFECAAIQGFPDPKAFSVGSVERRFRSIGNAVPPPLFAAVAGSLVRQFNCDQVQAV